MGKKIPLIEKIIVPNNYIKAIPLKESKTIVEGQEYECIAAYRFPFTRPGKENFNERIYPVTLWERVIKNKMGEGSYGLMDHPEDEGSVKDRWCVWHNVQMNENKDIAYADAYLFGRWGKEVHEGIKAGGKVGLSTVGFGEFMEDNKTINPETYELERVSDFVLNPSYDVFGTQEDLINDSKKTEEVLKKNTTINIDNKTPTDNGKIQKVDEKREIDKMDEKAKKLFETNFRLQVKTNLKGIDSQKDLYKKKVELEEVLNYFQEDFANDLKKEVEDRLVSVNKELKTLAEKGTQLDSINDSVKEKDKKIEELEGQVVEKDKQIKEITNKYNNAVELCDGTKDFCLKLQEKLDKKDETIRIKEAEKNGMVSPADYKEISVYCEQIEEELEEVKKENSELKKQLVKSKKEESTSEETENKKEKQEESEEKTHNELKFRNDAEVLKYYEEKLAEDPRVDQIKDEILGQKTRLEAEMKYLRLRGLLENESIMIRDPDSRVSEKSLFEKKGKSAKKSGFKIRDGWM